jgi:hypothetical protein
MSPEELAYAYWTYYRLTTNGDAGMLQTRESFLHLTRRAPLDSL